MSVAAVVTVAVACVVCPPDAPSPEPVYRLSGTHGRTVTLCNRHAWEQVPLDYQWNPPVPCEWCERSVIRSAPGRAYCSVGCADIARRRRQSEQRRLGRVLAPQVCDGCGRLFQPRRKGHRAHSAACRLLAWQRAQDRFAFLGPRSLWARLGNPEWGVVWCPGCKANTMPIRGVCPWCDYGFAAGGDRCVAVAA
jgi:hypothetical protein